VGVFSATNLPRLALRFGAMGLATSLVHAAVGGTLAEVPLAAVAVGGADQLTTRLWRRVGVSVQQAWTVTGLTLGTVSVLLILAGPRGPLASIRGAANGWVTRQQVDLDQRTAAPHPQRHGSARDVCGGPDLVRRPRHRMAPAARTRRLAGSPGVSGHRDAAVCVDGRRGRSADRRWPATSGGRVRVRTHDRGRSGPLSGGKALGCPL
jgi:hypothetical protein